MGLIAMIECADVVVSVVDSIDHDNQLSNGRILRYVSSYHLRHDEKLVNTWKMLV